MDWSEIIRECTPKFERICQQPITMSHAERLFRLIDLTRLNEDDTENDIAVLCKKAITSLGHVAGVCVYPRFIKMVAAEFDQSAVRTVTVANFPSGDDALEKVLLEVEQALQNGAQEIDVVFPYKRFLAGDEKFAATFVYAVKAACGPNVRLKVILETGAIEQLDQIAQASALSIDAGADFLKTSTGKIPQGASVPAVLVMLSVIREKDGKTGLKVAGGIRSAEEALGYIALADEIMGIDWVNPTHFRIGSSQLIDRLLQITR